MKKLTAVIILFIFALTSRPAFAGTKTWKIENPEDSLFNVMGNWVKGFGTTPGGKKIMGPEKKESWLDPDEIKERRKSVGGINRGMKRYE